MTRARLREALGSELETIDCEQVPWEILEAVHHRGYLDRIVRLRGSFPRIHAQQAILAGSLESILFSAGAAVSGVQAILAGRAARAFALAEPPGHHATADHGSGFCVLNNMAAAVAAARRGGAERLLLVDWDVHHGDGTQRILGSVPGVAIVDLHQDSLFPGTGSVDERGGGAVWNVPLPPGCGDDDYGWLLERLLRPIAERLRPELVLVSSGFDPHAEDPLGGMSLTDDGFGRLAACVRSVADEFCGGRLVVLLEGGYAPAAVARSVVKVVSALGGGPAGTALAGSPGDPTVAALERCANAHVACCGAGTCAAVLR